MSGAVDAWFARDRTHQDVLRALRRLLLELELEEGLKWRQPCYMVEGRNVAILGSRKDGCVLGMFQGALLDDPDGQLLAAGPNTRAARNVHFTSVRDLREREPHLRSLLTQAIALARAGRRVQLETPSEPVPEELLRAFDDDPELKSRFEGLTPGRRRGYLLHFNAGSKSATRASRVAQARARILAGKGLRDCICGRSARMPRCDGSHRSA